MRVLSLSAALLSVCFLSCNQVQTQTNPIPVPAVTYAEKADPVPETVVSGVDSLDEPFPDRYSVLSFTPIPFSDPDFRRPGAGAEQWSEQNMIDIPIPGVKSQPLDVYYRFGFTDIAPFNAPENTYNFNFFDAKINDAITKGQKFSFDVMPLCPICSQGVDISGARSFYPLYLHNQMQSESVKDFKNNGAWYPNWNSSYWLKAWKNLNLAINNHILTTSYKGIPYKNVIGYIDVSGYGEYGEWTNNNFKGPPEGRATAASLKSIIDATVQSYANFQCVILFGAFDGNQLDNTMIPPEVGYYALTTFNHAGPLGWRRENWGWTEHYNLQWSNLNPTVYRGFRFDTAIMNRYKYAPIVGEPADAGQSVYNGRSFGDLVRQIQFYHVSSFGNGNLNKSLTDTATADIFRTASKTAGYRLLPESGKISQRLSAAAPFSISLSWKNIGVAPTYENWNVVFELRNTRNETVWTGPSRFRPRLFLPSPKATVITDHFNLPSSVKPGQYDLVIKIKDKKGYRQPLPLGIKGRNPDGSYPIYTGMMVGTAGKSTETSISVPDHKTDSLAGPQPGSLSSK